MLEMIYEFYVEKIIEVAFFLESGEQMYHLTLTVQLKK